MQFFKKATAWMLVLCLVLSLALAVSPAIPAAAEEGETDTTVASTPDPYVYYYRPPAEKYPEYYARYARPYMLYSGHSVHHHAMDEGGYLQVRFFNVVNTAALIEDESQAPVGGYATTGAFCSDAETYIVAGATYRRMNLEDGYFNSNSNTTAGTVDARKIRAVLRNSMPNINDLPALEKKINAYLTATYGDEAVLVSGLSASQLISATQSAIWHYANDMDFGSPYPYQDSDDFASWSELTIEATSLSITYPDYPSSFMDVANDATATNISGVYQYLLSLPGENAREIIITDESVSLADAVISGSGDNCTLTVFVDIDGTINSDDELTLSAKCGDQVKSFSLGAVNTLNKMGDLYPITFTGVSEEACEAVELSLSGEQTVDDVCFFEAKPMEDSDGRKASQNLAGYGFDAAPVYSTATVNALESAFSLEITKVDEQSGNPLSGVAFDLYRKQEGEDLLIGSYITDENGKIAVSVTDADEYYFVETKALPGYVLVKGELDAGQVPNSWNAGSLSVSKKLINETPAQPDETFDFKLTLDLSTAPVMGNGISWMTGAYILEQLDCSKILTWSAAGDKLTATFTLNADETVTVSSIPLGATYTLEEVMTEEDRAWFTVTTKIDDGTDQKGNTATGTVAERNAILFTNSVVTDEVKLGDLEISKKLINTTPAVVGETFHFRITLDFSTADIYTKAIPWMNDEYLMGFITGSEELTWTEKDGKYVADFTVDADETVSIAGIARGTTFTVEEVLTEEDRQWFESTSQIGGSVAGSVAQSTVAEKNAVIFTNSVVTGPVLVTGSVEVSKKLINTTPAVVGETFNFQITLDLSTADVYTNAAPWMNDEYLMGFITGSEELTWIEQDGKYVATFTVDADETVTIGGIAQGTTYTVQEILTEEDREWFTVTSQIGDEEAKDSDTVESTVAEQNAVLFTNTVVTGIELTIGELKVSKELVNASEAKAHEEFTFQITIDLATADIYQDPAPWMYDEYLLDQIVGTKELTWTKVGQKMYTATFTLKGGESISIDGIARSTGYTLEEVLTKEERNLYRVTTAVAVDGATPVNGTATLVSGRIAQENAVIFTNECMEKIPVTEDLSLTSPLVLCLLAVLMVAVLCLNKRRFIG